MVKRIVVVKESLPSRCDICHQTDLFNSELNYCERCENTKAIVEKEPVNKDLPADQKNTLTQNSTQKTTLRISISGLTGILAWKIFIRPLIKELIIIFNINLSVTDYFSLLTYLFTFVVLISACIGWKIRFLDKIPIERLVVTSFTLMVMTLCLSIVEKWNYVTHTQNTLLEILSIVLPATVGFIINRRMSIKSKK